MKLKNILFGILLVFILGAVNAQVSPYKYKPVNKYSKTVIDIDKKNPKTISGSTYKKNYMSKKQTEVVYVIDNKSQKLTHVVLYNTFTSQKKKALNKKYRKSSFLTGYVKGDYQIKNGDVLAKKGASFVIIKDTNASLFDKSTPVFIEIPKREQYTGKFEFIPGKKYLPGDMFVLFNSTKFGSGYGRPYGDSKLKVEVMKNNQKQTVLKVL